MAFGEAVEIGEGVGELDEEGGDEQEKGDGLLIPTGCRFPPGGDEGIDAEIEENAEEERESSDVLPGGAAFVIL